MKIIENPITLSLRIEIYTDSFVQLKKAVDKHWYSFQNENHADQTAFLFIDLLNNHKYFYQSMLQKQGQIIFSHNWSLLQ